MPPSVLRTHRSRGAIVLLTVVCGVAALPFLLKAVGVGLEAALVVWWLAVLTPLCAFIVIRGAGKGPRKRGFGPPAVVAIVFLGLTIASIIASAGQHKATDFQRNAWLTPFTLAALFGSFSAAIARTPKGPTGKRPDR